MSVAGFDIGNATSCVAVARKGGIDVLLNKESNRETPTVISFNQKQRFLGTDAAPSLAINPTSTVTQLKRLIGKIFADSEVQKDIAALPFKVLEGSDGKVVVEVKYLDKSATFTPEQLVAMMLVDQKRIAEMETGGPITDCVVACPVFFTEAERYALLSAAQIAGLNCLRLMNETTATALAYGIYKTDLPEKDPVYVAFIDFSHSSYQVAIVAYKKGQLQVLSHTWDRDLGGRDLDNVLFQHFADEFKEKYKIDVRSNQRASFRLTLACEKLKKMLSANPEAPINVECLMNDIDVSGFITREKFEQLAAPLFERCKAPLEEAIKASGISVGQISAVEVIGGSSRVPAFLRVLADVFQGKEPGRTLNAKEVVSRGCALQCAMLSPIFRVREFEVIDSFPYAVSVTWDKDGEPTTSVLFDKGSPLPSAKILTFFRSASFTIKAQYTDDSPLPQGFNKDIGTFTFGPLTPSEGQEKAKLKVKVRLNLHSIVTVESAQQIEEEEVLEEAAAAPAAATDATADVPMADAAPADAVPNGAEQKAEDGATPMDTEKQDATTAPEKMVKRKRTKKTAVPFQAVTAALTAAQMQELFEKECELALQAKIQEETSERKNALESYVYDLRNKLYDVLSDYITESDKTQLMSQLDDLENWLYDEGEDQPKSVYVKKFEELRKVGDPIEARYQDAQTRDAAAASLASTCSNFLNIANSTDAKYAHISPEDKAKVSEECERALAWLKEKQELQSQMKKADEPVLRTADIKKKEDMVVRVCEPILTKPPPAKKEEAMDTDEAAATAEGKEGDAAAAGTESNAAPGEAAQAEPMHEEKA